MAEERLTLEPEVQQILRCVDEKRNFLLSGGAGSGKTYSLVQVIRQLIAESPTAKVACMTYTNAAVKEIEERVNHKNLNVTTIHDFLWDNIKHFQKELKLALVELANNPDISKIAIDGVNPVPNDYFDQFPDGIQYKEYLRVREGIISHDELLIVAHFLFQKYPKLVSVVKDKYRFILIDEYQDTSPMVVEIFLRFFANSSKQNIIGFFGDAMQSIYDDGVGNLDEYKGDHDGAVKEIKKTQNRRNPQKVITLANLLRTDGIVQVPSTDQKAPNMLDGRVKEGSITFIYSTDGNIQKVRDFLTAGQGWNFDNSKETKELNLTHNLIADKAGFMSLMEIYDNDPIMGLKDDILKKIKDNRRNNSPEIVIDEADTFDTVLDKFQLKNRQRQLKKDVVLQDPKNAALYAQLKDKAFAEVRKMYVDKSSLIDDKKQDEHDENRKGSKRDNLIKHLFKIERNISLYKTGKFNEFLRITDFRTKVQSIADKRTLKQNIEELTDVGEKTIEEVILDAHNKGITLIDESLERFRVDKEYLFNRVKNVKFREFQKLFEYLEGKTPFSTQHKTKGAQFDNVLVILNNGDWNYYNFEGLFTGDGTTSVIERTQKIFYVCCTRAKEKLAVFYHDPSQAIITRAQTIFGAENVVGI